MVDYTVYYIRICRSRVLTNFVFSINVHVTLSVSFHLQNNSCFGMSATFLLLIPQVHINLKGKKLEHHGIRVEFVGQIGMLHAMNHRYLYPVVACRNVL